MSLLMIILLLMMLIMIITIVIIILILIVIILIVTVAIRVITIHNKNIQFLRVTTKIILKKKRLLNYYMCVYIYNGIIRKLFDNYN